MTSPASVTVIAGTCAEADAWATALMVLGAEVDATLAQQRGLDALFLMREGQVGVRGVAIGRFVGRDQKLGYLPAQI